MRKALFALAVAGVVGACSGTSEPDPNRVVTVTVTAPLTNLVAGGTTQATATAIRQDGSSVSNPTITWSSSTPNVASVSNTGLITGVAPGTATISAEVTGPGAMFSSLMDLPEGVTLVAIARNADEPEEQD